MRHSISLGLCALLLASPVGASAQEAPRSEAATSAENSVIVVTGNDEGYRLASKELRAAAKAFGKYRQRYAPEGRLLIEVKLEDEGSLSGLELWLDSDDQTIELPLDAQGRFELPILAKGKWRLATSRGAIALRLRPWVYSPGSTFGDWRLGDLHLQCRVAWAIGRQSTSVLIKGLFDVAGGCRSRSVAIMFSMGRPISSASISDDDKNDDLEFEAPDLLRLPTYLRDYSNEARVLVDFE